MAFVSGGKILAIGKVKHNGTLIGDGAEHPLQVIGAGTGGGVNYEFEGDDYVTVDKKEKYDEAGEFIEYDVAIGLKDAPFTQTDADKLYANKTDIADMETKTHVSETYQPIGEYVTSAGFNEFNDSLNTWKTSVENSASNISSYIASHENQWSQGNDYQAGLGLDENKFEKRIIGLDLASAQRIENALTEHQSLDGYAKESWVEGQGYLSATEFTKWQTDVYDKFEGNITQSANNLSAYIKANEEHWNKDIIYTAGVGIDETKIVNNEIAINSTSAKKIEDALVPADLNGYATEQWVTAKAYQQTSAFEKWTRDEYTLFKTEYGTFSGDLISSAGKIIQSADNLSAYVASHEKQWAADTTYTAGLGIDETKFVNNEIAINSTSAKKIEDALVKDDLNGYATEQWVNTQGFLKEHQSLENYYQKNETSAKEAISAALAGKQPIGEYVTSAGFIEFRTTDYDVFKQDVTHSAANLSAYSEAVSAYINQNEPEWKKGTSYSAGEWIASDKLNDNVIEVSGVKSLIADDPLVISEDEEGKLHIGMDGFTIQTRLINITSKGDAESADGEITAKWNEATKTFVFHFNKIGWYHFSCNALFKPLVDAKPDEYSYCGFTSDSVRVAYQQPVYNAFENGTFVSCTSLVNVTSSDVTLTFFCGNDQELTNNIDICIMEA